MSFFRLFEQRFSTSCSLFGSHTPSQTQYTFGICSVAVESHEWKATIVRDSLHKRTELYIICITLDIEQYIYMHT